MILGMCNPSLDGLLSFCTSYKSRNVLYLLGCLYLGQFVSAYSFPLRITVSLRPSPTMGGKTQNLEIFSTKPYPTHVFGGGEIWVD